MLQVLFSVGRSGSMEARNMNSLELYGRMLLIRHFEEAVARLFAEGSVPGTCHLAVGQEACAVGSLSRVAPADQVVSNHRGHGHALAKGADPRKLMAEILGRKTGYCMGKGGSQHVSAVDVGFLGTNGITGGGIPIATGAALSAKLRRTNGIVVCFFGDGASNQGTFHESLNMAAVWHLPILYFCENNGYAMSMPVGRSTMVPNIAGRAAGYGMRSSIVDGMDLAAVMKATDEAVDSIRKGSGPWLLEAKTYRFSGHSRSDQRVYRTREEEADWQKRDPIALWKTRLTCEGAGADEIAGAEREAVAAVAEAVRFARESGFESPENALAGVYA